MKVRVSERLKAVLRDPKARAQLHGAISNGGSNLIVLDGKRYELVSVGSAWSAPREESRRRSARPQPDS